MKNLPCLCLLVTILLSNVSGASSLEQENSLEQTNSLERENSLELENSLEQTNSPELEGSQTTKDSLDLEEKPTQDNNLLLESNSEKSGNNLLNLNQKTEQVDSSILIEPSEELIAQPPNDWHQIYYLNTDTTRFVDFVPKEETADAWKTKLSFESHQSLTDIDPISIVMGELDQTQQNCEKIESFNLFSGLENNYPTSVRLTFCGENAHTQEGEISITKVIQGNEYLYIIKLLHRVAAFDKVDDSATKSQVAAWSNYFGNINVCQKDSPEHPCSTTDTASDPG